MRVQDAGEDGTTQFLQQYLSENTRCTFSQEGDEGQCLTFKPAFLSVQKVHSLCEVSLYSLCYVSERSLVILSVEPQIVNGDLLSFHIIFSVCHATFLSRACIQLKSED